MFALSGFKTIDLLRLFAECGLMVSARSRPIRSENKILVGARITGTKRLPTRVFARTAGYESRSLWKSPGF
jgi:hypothetical protein